MTPNLRVSAQLMGLIRLDLKEQRKDATQTSYALSQILNLQGLTQGVQYARNQTILCQNQLVRDLDQVGQFYVSNLIRKGKRRTVMRVEIRFSRYHNNSNQNQM